MFFSCEVPLRRQVLTPVIITSKHPPVGTRHGVSAQQLSLCKGDEHVVRRGYQSTVPLTGGRVRSAEGVNK